MYDEVIPEKLDKVREDEYGYPTSEEGKGWLDLIIDFVKQRKEGSQPKLEKVA